MKRNIVINSMRTAIVISDHLLDAVETVCKDCMQEDEILAFDTYLHLAYAWKVTGNTGYTLIEHEIPVEKFRSFGLIGDCSDIYKELITSLIR